MPSGRSTTNVWAKEVHVGKNVIRQLLVREHDDVALDERADGSLWVATPYGTWPARRGGKVESAAPLTAVLPVLDSGSGRVTWRGSLDQVAPERVLASFEGAIGFTRHGQPNSLRRPQIGALHSIVGYQASGLTEPGVVVMPTGTGKTETMLAWFVAEQPVRVLVVVPSRALRDQIASKFETLGILQRLGIVASGAMRPTVGRLEHRFEDEGEARAFVDACNVVVATAAAVQANDRATRALFFSQFSHLLVDEAHHAPATTWSEIIQAFADHPVLLFTATPFRRDGRSLPGKIIFRFPLREAQREGYFSSIDFTAVLDVDDDDTTLARAALDRLRADIATGYEHILLARVDRKTRADEIHALYKRLAPDLAPCLLYDTMPRAARAAALEAISTRSSRVIVCVDMLGEGFDLPTLKVGAFHDSHKSLSPLIQLIGRLARTESPDPIGSASVFVRQDPRDALSPMRFLLREDPDWNTVLSDITERATQRADELNTFEASFVGVPEDVPVGLLEPKMSAIAFATSSDTWDPDRARDVYGESLLDGLVSTNADANVAWFVIETIGDVRWGDIPSLRKTDYTLVAMHFDRIRGLLYIHSSDTKRTYEDLAELVLGHEPDQVKGYDTFRVFDGLDRVIPTNVGLLDARDRDKRFSMFVGSDVETALTEAERTHKANTHVAARAFADGDSVTIAASLSGRFWSMSTASNLADWRQWCQSQGTKLVNRTIDVHRVFRDMIIPTDVKTRPPYPVLAMEWPWELYLGTGTAQRVVHCGSGALLTDAELRVDNFSSTGPLYFSVVAADWQVSYEASFSANGLHYKPVGSDDADVTDRRGVTVPLSAWFNRHKPTLFLSGDRMVTGDDRLLEPREDVPPYPRTSLNGMDWANIDIKVESQGVERRPDSIQAHMVRHLLGNQSFDVLIDDDRAGEAADLVGIRIERDSLHVTLVHCKYSKTLTPGGRLADLYEVCGQAMRGARWRDKGGLPLLEHLDRRVASYARRTGGTAFEVGDRAALFRIRQRAPQLFVRVTTLIAQPGLSVAQSTDEQLRLIAGAASYVQTVTKGGFEVYCSA